MYLRKIPSNPELDAAGATAATLLDEVENDTREALLWALNRQELRLLVARLKHIRRRRQQYFS